MARAKNKIITTLLAVIMAFSLTACGEKPCEHIYDNACDTICEICSEERTITHTPNADDGNCLTEITCSVCGTVTTEAKENHTLEKYVDNKDGTHSPACLYCDYVDTTTTEWHMNYIDENCKCEKCGMEHYLPYVDEGYCWCDYCGEYIHNFDENCICTVCSLIVHTVNSTTGICSVCNTFTAAASITVDGVKTYYATFDEAINFANGRDGTVIVIENDCYHTGTFFESGSVIIDLNGKTIEVKGNYSIVVNGANVTIRDSIGGGKTLGDVGGWSGTLIVESGTHNFVTPPKNLIIIGGVYARVAVTTGETATISGGSFEKIEVYSGAGTLADILADGYCFYDKDGNVVDISTIQTDSSGWYNLYNVTVGAIQ